MWYHYQYWALTLLLRAGCVDKPHTDKSPNISQPPFSQPRMKVLNPWFPMSRQPPTLSDSSEFLCGCWDWIIRKLMLVHPTPETIKGMVARANGNCKCIVLGKSLSGPTSGNSNTTTTKNADCYKYTKCDKTNFFSSILFLRPRSSRQEYRLYIMSFLPSLLIGSVRFLCEMKHPKLSG